MMTLKEFFIAVRAHFLEDHAMHMQDSGERWMTEGLCHSVTALHVASRLNIVIKARELLEAYRPPHSGAWWFPVRKSESYDECIAPRLEILDEIINSL